MKRGFLTSVTVTVETVATLRQRTPVESGFQATNLPPKLPTVATVATVSVISKENIDSDGVGVKHENLCQFQFDLIEKEIAAGYSAEKLSRVNNMAWQFMRVDGMAFNEAITLSASIVAGSQLSEREAAYIDVMALFNKLLLAVSVDPPEKVSQHVG